MIKINRNARNGDVLDTHARYLAIKKMRIEKQHEISDDLTGFVLLPFAGYI